MNNLYDIVIIGYGVSGLCLGSKLDTTKFRTLIIEQGKPHHERNHEDNVESLIGCGGAGLFSDGKFSFYPAGTEVWKLSQPKLLKGYQDVIDVMMPFMKLSTDLDNSQNHIQVINNECDLKIYPSYYLSLSQRLELIQNLVNNYNGDVLYQHHVNSINKSNSLYHLEIEDLVNNLFKMISCKYIVFAGGRYNPLYFKEFNKKFLRIEYGARIVANSNNNAMKQPDIVDPKYIIKNDRYQARTFCWCKNGEYILTDNSQGIKAYSGRSDVSETDKTNFGLNIRLTNPSMLNFERYSKVQPFHIKTNGIGDDDLATKIKNVMGDEYGEYFFEALSKLLIVLPDLKNNIDIIGPTIEGVGYYPDINRNTLQIHNENMYVCGDASGIFRGIVASMISGYFIAHTFNEIHNNSIN